MVKEKKKFSFPSAYTVILIVLLLVMALTYFIPAGKFETIQYQSESKAFIITDVNGKEQAPIKANQSILDEHDIKIDLAKFEDGSISKPVAIPGSYQELDEKRPGLFGAIKNFLHAPIQGLADSIGIVTFILILGGIIGVINKTGAFTAGMNALSKKLDGKEKWLIIIISTLIAIGGTTFGLAEETVAFYPILVPIFMAAGYDALVAIATIYLGSSIGSMASTVNPFSVVIASNTAGINFTDGMGLRLVMLVVGTIMCIVYTIRYAEKVRKDASQSLIFDQKSELEAQFLTQDPDAEAPTFDSRKKILLSIFAGSFIIMVFGVKDYGWSFDEISALFLGVTFVMAFISGLGEKTFVSEFIAGAADLLGVALVCALARGVTIIMEDAKISDTLMQWLSTGVSHMSGVVFTTVMFFVFILLGFFIPSSSGLAVLSMPVMAPLADVVGLDRSLIVDAYNWGQGIISFITPTGLVLASLAMVNISFDKWLKFVTPLMIAIGLLAIVLLGVGVYI
ncbi:YfcC family protein [Vagococcus intermedius]|uniref:YfcC family protein n=1 Tax=Vagococcus intermedius TaxID=2991418 RepID=A0AAF0I6L8_9ENTE|nr:YfcC family protein [Vagococcus intermedius]WEG72750.1 YfcC family protein [Vagococcus intermedius]WEG74836.1 YfcC family protein [Vagococcus intermedius]